MVLAILGIALAVATPSYGTTVSRDLPKRKLMRSVASLSTLMAFTKKADMYMHFIKILAMLFAARSTHRGTLVWPVSAHGNNACTCHPITNCGDGNDKIDCGIVFTYQTIKGMVNLENYTL